MGFILAVVLAVFADGPARAGHYVRGSGQAQTPREGRLLVTVIDPSGAVIPNAIVTVAGEDDATKGITPAAVKTSDRGIATLAGLAFGRYSIHAEFPGFEPGLLKDVRVRSGDNRHVLVLAIKRIEDSVTVARDAQAVAADPRARTSGTTLTREEIDALSDDPAELAQQLLDMAGGNAVFKVDSFLGAPLPPKAQIKSIHIVRDAFAAENHSAESDEIEIITQPGVGPIRGGFTSLFRDGSMSARSPFTPTKGPERTQRYEGRIGGSVVRNKSSFALTVGSRRAFDTPNLNVALPGGTRSEILNLRRPNDNWFVYGLFDYALTRDQTLRLAYEQSGTIRRNLGVGAYDLPERAYSTNSHGHELRVQEVGPIGRRAFANTRLLVDWSDSSSRAGLEAPTVRVSDAFTSGGAQISGGRRSRDFEFASDIDYIRGKHTVRTGFLLEGIRSRSDGSNNYLGTYSFTSLAAYEANRPAIYTRRIGDPLVQYWNLEAGVYVQDDIRVRKNLTLSPGLRYEAQTHLGDGINLGPRFGVMWAPFKSGRTTLRGSWGIFHNWLNTGTYEQTLRVDGFRQRELIIVNPEYPDPGLEGAAGNVINTRATNRYLLGDDIEMPRIVRVSSGIDQTLTPKVRVSFTYSNTRASGLFRGLNLNALVATKRPDPAFANVIQVTGDGRSRSQQLQTSLNVNLSAGSRTANQARWNWRRATMRVTYWRAAARNDVDGPFSVPASGSLATEWGPGPEDRRHRVSASLATQALRNLNANLSLAANSGTPYTITTGLDDNGDSIFNDRPAGVGRNSVRTPSQWTVLTNVSYAVGLGVRPASGTQSGGERAQPSPRYRLSFNVSVINLTNHSNYAGFSGVMTSPFFEQPTAVTNPRKIDFGMSFGF